MRALENRSTNREPDAVTNANPAGSTPPLELRFGRRAIRLSIDDAYELQIELARQLAVLELGELEDAYPEELGDEEEGLSESRSVLEALSRYRASLV